MGPSRRTLLGLESAAGRLLGPDVVTAGTAAARHHSSPDLSGEARQGRRSAPRSEVVTPSATDVPIAQLRDAMVDQILTTEPVSAAVEAAMRTVPRELFLPDTSPAEAYQDQVVITKRDFDGNPLSSVTQPSTVAAMLEQLRVEPGHQILELGSGGYNAALLATLTGRTGSVVTLDIDQEVIRRTHERLHAAGYTGITALISDGRFGLRLRAPYDRIIVTIDTPDVPQDWIDQLVEGGRIIIPLQLRGLTRTIAFTRIGEILTSDAIKPYSFVPMQGLGVPRRTAVTLADGIRLDVGTDQHVNTGALRGAIAGPRYTVRTGVTPAPDGSVPPSLDLWLATVQATFGRLHTDATTRQQPPVTPTGPAGVSAAWTDDTIACLTLEHTTGAGYEIRVIAYGPDRRQLAGRLAHDVRSWDAERRGGPDPTIRIYPRGTTWDALPPGRLFDTPSAQLLITWG